MGYAAEVFLTTDAASNKYFGKSLDATGQSIMKWFGLAICNIGIVLYSATKIGSGSDILCKGCAITWVLAMALSYVDLKSGVVVTNQALIVQSVLAALFAYLGFAD